MKLDRCITLLSTWSKVMARASLYVFERFCTSCSDPQSSTCFCFVQIFALILLEFLLCFLKLLYFYCWSEMVLILHFGFCILGIRVPNRSTHNAFLRNPTDITNSLWMLNLWIVIYIWQVRWDDQNDHRTRLMIGHLVIFPSSSSSLGSSME